MSKGILSFFNSYPLRQNTIKYATVGHCLTPTRTQKANPAHYVRMKQHLVSTLRYSSKLTDLGSVQLHTTNTRHTHILFTVA